MYPSISGIGQQTGQLQVAAAYPALPQQGDIAAEPAGQGPYHYPQQQQQYSCSGGGSVYASQPLHAQQSFGPSRLPGVPPAGSPHQPYLQHHSSYPSVPPMVQHSVQQQYSSYTMTQLSASLPALPHQQQQSAYPGMQPQQQQQQHQQQQQYPSLQPQQQEPLRQQSGRLYPQLPDSLADATPYGSMNSAGSSSHGSMLSMHSMPGGSSFSSSSGHSLAAASAPAALYAQQPQQPYPGLLPSQSYPQQQQLLQPCSQQQQEQQKLPAYPPVPKPLPYTAPLEKVQNGYDVMVYIVQARNLPGMDWWNGLADPYVVITAMPAGVEPILYKTKTVYRDLNPTFDEFFELANLPTNTSVIFEVWDKDVLTEDDMIGRCCWMFTPKELAPSSTAGGGMLGGDSSWGRLLVPLKLQHPRSRKDVGTVEIEVTFRPSLQPGKPAMMGPVKFKQTLSPTAGLFTGHFWGREDTMSFSTYKLYLMHIESTFGEVRMPWNRKYDKAVQIFKNPVALTMVRTQHASLYASSIGFSRCGVLTGSQDFFDLFKGGMRGGQRRYFTYCLLKDSLRCSETGAAFFNDMMSKHAMHSGGEEQVLYAGEFCIVPEAAAPGGHRLVIDNNSGTYAPDSKQLHLMKDLFLANFPEMCVEVLPVGDRKLKQYQQQCPSRATA